MKFDYYKFTEYTQKQNRVTNHARESILIMKDTDVYLHNIIDRANEATIYCKGKSQEDFLKDGKTQSAVILELVVIGEEAEKLSKEVRREINLPWRKIIGFSNVAVRKYFDVDLNQIWDTVQNDLPHLIQVIKSYLNGNVL